MIRVAQIVGKWLGGGVEAVVMNYYRHIDRTKIQFDFICDADSTNIPLEEIESLGGKVIIIPPYQKLFKYLRELKKILKNGQYKIVHSHISTLSVFPLYAAKKAGVPVRIAHSHSTSNKKEWKRNLIKNFLRLFSKKYANVYFCCSEVAGRYLFGDKEYNKGNVHLLKNAVEINKFTYNESVRIQKRKELGINASTTVFGHVGRFVSQKNHLFLVDVFNEYQKLNPDSILLLAGQGPLVETVKEKVKAYKIDNKVKFLGQRSDVNELYQAFDTVVLPSLYEGLVVVLVEAQCAGLPCFCSKEVSPETKISDNLDFLSLKDSPYKWAFLIDTKLKTFVRKDCSKTITEYGYNIETESIQLEIFYTQVY